MTPTTHASPGRIVIAGGSGFLGRNLAAHWANLGGEPIVLSRQSLGRDFPWKWEEWDARSVGGWKAILDGAAAIVNLAGRTVDCIKSPDHCDEILRSRVEATRALGQAVRATDRPPPVWVQMSTAHIYGDPPSAICDESSVAGYGLAPTVGKAWEAEFELSALPEMRRVVLRTSFVLGMAGAAMKKLTLVTRLGLGGRAGHGRQGISWIHEHDMNRLFERALLDPLMNGAYVATAPHPVSNAQFMAALRKAVGMPIGLPAFEWMIRLGAPLLLRTDPELALYGRYCVPTRLLAEGFRFEYPEIGVALHDLLRSRRD